MKKIFSNLSVSSILLSIFILILFSILLITATPEPAISGNLEWRTEANPVLDHDRKTLLKGDMEHPGGVAQLIWVGPNGVIDPPLPNGLPGGDDQLVKDSSFDRGRTSGENPIYIGYGAGPEAIGKFYISDITYSLVPGQKVYTRVFNAQSAEAAAYYGQSDPYELTGKIGEGWDCTAVDQIITDIPH